MNAAAWERAERILCIRLDSLGDVLMTTPAICALRTSRAGRHITLLTSRAGAAVGRLVPAIDAVIAYDAPWMRHPATAENNGHEGVLIEQLRRARYDAAVIFTVYSQNPLPAAFLCYLAGIPLTLAHCHENPYALLSNWVPDPEPQHGIRHEVRRQLDLVATIGATVADERLVLHVPDAAQARVGVLLRARGVDVDRPWLVIHPGGTAASRRYPPERFAEIGRRLAREHGYQVLLTGEEGERELIAQIQAQMGVESIAVAGVLALGDLAALIQRSPILICGNTGPAHIAAAVGTPVVDLYALTNPQHTPWGVPCRVLSHDVPCKYCYKSTCPEGHHRCLRLITPDEVIRATCELLGERQMGTSRKEVLAS
jgi:lipopolysaccharide heptosyltransferase II